jgi:DNA-binding CsgD family transcriptional regulator
MPIPEELYQEYDALLSSQVFDPDTLDYSMLKTRIPLLESLDVVDNGYISVFDMYQKKHVYYSPKFEKFFGWDLELAAADTSYTSGMIHPEDLPLLYKAGIIYLELGLTMPDKTRSKEYKAVFEYRIKDRTGEYVRVIEQQVPMEFDNRGNVWLALSMVDLSPDKDLNAPFRGRLINIKTRELYQFPPEEDKQVTVSLTNREKEILEMIAKGLISKEIADKLFISVNTVNTHRQRIIEKLNVSNTYEAIRYAQDRGIFL